MLETLPPRLRGGGAKGEDFRVFPLLTLWFHPCLSLLAMGVGPSWGQKQSLGKCDAAITEARDDKKMIHGGAPVWEGPFPGPLFFNLHRSCLREDCGQALPLPVSGAPSLRTVALEH